MSNRKFEKLVGESGGQGGSIRAGIIHESIKKRGLKVLYEDDGGDSYYDENGSFIPRQGINFYLI